MIGTANKGGNPMASQFKKTVSTFSMRNLREGRVFPLDATPLRNVGTKLATPLRNVGAKLVLFAARAWLRYFLPLIRRYGLALLGALIALPGAVVSGLYLKNRWKKARQR